MKLAQQVDGIVVDQGELRVLLHPDGSLAAISGTLLPATTRPNFVSSPPGALGHALDQQYGTSRPQLAITDAGETGGWQALEVASTPALQVTSARARRTLAQVDDHLTEAWEVELEGDAGPDPLSDPSIPTFSAHSYLVADAGGKILRDVDLVQHDAYVYRAYMETTGNRRPLDGALQSFAPHPTGVPDGSAPSLIPANLVVMEAFNGPGDPWLANNATTTSGNNAEAFADLDANRVFGSGDVRPVVKSGRVLNYTYNHELEPLATPDQSQAAAVNAFFMVNWMHDWWYDSGFTETTGDGQLDNLGRGGVANDQLLVTSQAGANTGLRNNADMSTPADGARPRMRMFLWTAGTNTAVITPAGTRRSEAFAAGPRNFDLTGSVVAVTDTVAPNNDGCETITSNAVPGPGPGAVDLHGQGPGQRERCGRDARGTGHEPWCLRRGRVHSERHAVAIADRVGWGTAIAAASARLHGRPPSPWPALAIPGAGHQLRASVRPDRPKSGRSPDKRSPPAAAGINPVPGSPSRDPRARRRRRAWHELGESSRCQSSAGSRRRIPRARTRLPGRRVAGGDRVDAPEPPRVVARPQQRC